MSTNILKLIDISQEIQIENDKLVDEIRHLKNVILGQKNRQITREQFMEFFRSEDFQEKMSADDCIEIYKSVLKGSSDLTAELLNGIISDYGVTNLTVIKTPNFDNEHDL